MIFQCAEETHLSTNNNLKIDKSLRRATTNSLSVVHLIKKMFSHIDTDYLEENSKDFGFVYTSFHGELNPTQTYLRNYAQEGLCRPFVFQNSLHHSTPGFASSYFNFQGPAYTLTHQSNDLQVPTQLAHSLLAAGQAHSFLVIACDTMPTDLPIKDFIQEDSLVCKGAILSNHDLLKSALKTSPRKVEMFAAAEATPC